MKHDQANSQIQTDLKQNCLPQQICSGTSGIVYVKNRPEIPETDSSSVNSKCSLTRSGSQNEAFILPNAKEASSHKKDLNGIQTGTSEKTAAEDFHKSENRQQGIQIEEDLHRFACFLREQEREESTIKNYLRSVRFFLNEMTSSKTLDELDKNDLRNYKSRLCSVLKTSTVNNRISAVNRYLDWKEKGELKMLQMKMQPQAFIDESKNLTREDFKKMVHTAIEKEDYTMAALLNTLACTGIRISELPCITIESLHEQKVSICLKGKTREILYPKKLTTLLEDYCRGRQIESGPVFITSGGRPLDRSNVWKMMKAIAKESGVEPSKVFPHNFRHLFARSFYDSCQDLARLADLLGHSSVNTTRIYVRATADQFQEIIDSMDLYCS